MNLVKFKRVKFKKSFGITGILVSFMLGYVAGYLTIRFVEQLVSSIIK